MPPYSLQVLRYTRYFFILLYFPLEESAGILGWLNDFELDSTGYDWVELYGVGYTLVKSELIRVCDWMPLTLLIGIINVPRLWHATATPRSIVEPIDGRRLDLGSLWEGIRDPFSSTLLWPPVIVWYRTVVLILRNEAVVNGIDRSNHVRSIDLAL